MSSKQIVGVILLIAGLIMGFIGGVNLMDIASFESSSAPAVQLGLAFAGVNIDNLKAKYGVLLFLGMVFLVIGVIMAGKEKEAKGE